jgi:hypothetical protein
VVWETQDSSPYKTIGVFFPPNLYRPITLGQGSAVTPVSVMALVRAISSAYILASFKSSSRKYHRNTVTCKGFRWVIIRNSGSDDWVYWYFFTITVDRNSSHIELLNEVCLTNRYEESLTDLRTWITLRGEEDRTVLLTFIFVTRVPSVFMQGTVHTVDFFMEAVENWKIIFTQFFSCSHCSKTSR